MEKAKELLNLLRKYNIKGMSHLGTLFKTNDTTYYYDTGTGKVCSCGEKEEFIISVLLDNKSEQLLSLSSKEFGQAFDNIMDLIINENMFQFSSESDFMDLNNLENLVNTQLEHMILELTQQCNLSCKYCIYNEYSDFFRDFTMKKMSFEIAQKAIDYGLEHCGDELIIGFYGGEPLLQFDLIKNIIAYVNQKNVNNKTLKYSLTTNLILMDKEKADFFASLENCYITCSIDGPEDIHNQYRIKRSEEGSFQNAFNGLRTLVSAYGDRSKDLLSIYSVICPPYTKEHIQDIVHFFDSLEWLPREILCSFTKVKDGTLPNAIIDKYDKEKSLDFKVVQDYLNQELIKINDKNSYIVKCEKNDLMKIHNRLLIDSPINKIPMNGCCIPGKRRIHVTSDGEFLICEKMGNSPIVGNVKEGLNITKLHEKYIDDYTRSSREKCKSCWAAYLCPICYSSCYDEKGFDIDAKELLCKNAKEHVKQALQKYHELMEKNPNLLMEIIQSTQQ